MLERRTLLSSTLPPIAPLGPEFQINTYTGGYQESPSIASDPAGDFVVVWHNQDRNASTDDGVYAQRYDANGQRVGTEFRANTFTTGIQRYGSVGMDANGRFVIAWQSAGQDGSDEAVYAQRYDAAGQPLGTEFRVNTTTTGAQYGPRVVVGPSGDFIIAWEAGTAIYLQRYNASGATVGTETKINTQSGISVIQPSIALMADGGFAVVWRNIDSSPAAVNTVRGQLFGPSGSKIGGELVVNAPAGSSVDSPTVGADSAGNFVVTWSNNISGTQHVLGQRFDASGAAVGSLFQVDEQSSGASPRVHVFPGGDFVVTWNSGSFDDVFYRRFDADAMPSSGELRANTFTPGMQYHPDLAASATGDLVLVWSSVGQDGDKSGALGQRFPVIANPASVSGVTWNDLNGDGIRQAEEPAIQGVAVTLFTAAGTMVNSGTSGSDGSYRFDDLRPGDSCYVQFGAPTGLLFTLPLKGTDPGLDSDADVTTGKSTAVTPTAAGQSVTAIDAGFVVPASVGGFVWSDTDLNGVRDAAEPGRGNISVSLFTESGQLVATVSTAADGTYRFDSLRPGVRYFIQVTTPLGLALTTADRGANDNVDSDPEPLSRTTPLFPLAPAQVDLSWSTGLVPQATVSGNLFRTPTHRDFVTPVSRSCPLGYCF